MNLRVNLTSLLLGASLLGLNGCAANPADNVPKAGVGTPGTSATTVAAASVTPGAATPTPGATPGATGSPSAAAGDMLPFAADSQVGFSASKVTGSHTGGFNKISGGVAVPGGDLEKATIDVTIDMSSTFTDDEKLTGHLTSPDFFDVAKFPTSTFKSQSIAKTADGYLVTGDLTLHGVTKTINFPAQISLQNGALETQAEFAINRKDFAIVYPGKPDDLIRDDVVIKFNLKAGAQS